MSTVKENKPTVKQDLLLQLKDAFYEGFNYGSATKRPSNQRFLEIQRQAFWVVSDTNLRFHGLDPKKENESLDRFSKQINDKLYEQELKTQF